MLKFGSFEPIKQLPISLQYQSKLEKILQLFIQSFNNQDITREKFKAFLASSLDNTSDVTRLLLQVRPGKSVSEYYPLGKVNKKNFRKKLKIWKMENSISQPKKILVNDLLNDESTWDSIMGLGEIQFEGRQSNPDDVDVEFVSSELERVRAEEGLFPSVILGNDELNVEPYLNTEDSAYILSSGSGLRSTSTDPFIFDNIRKS